MIAQKSTGDLLEVLRNKPTYEKAQQEIMDGQYIVDLAEYLNSLAEERGLKQSDIMRRSGLKKSYFYQLFDGRRGNPSRDTLIQLGFGFEMSLDEVQEFLKHMGAAQLYPRIPRDGVLIYAFQRRMSIIDCDILLADNGEKTLVSE